MRFAIFVLLLLPLAGCQKEISLNEVYESAVEAEHSGDWEAFASLLTAESQDLVLRAGLARAEELAEQNPKLSDELLSVVDELPSNDAPRSIAQIAKVVEKHGYVFREPGFMKGSTLKWERIEKDGTGTGAYEIPAGSWSIYFIKEGRRWKIDYAATLEAAVEFGLIREQIEQQFD